MNSVSIHNAGNDALALIQELKKMGLLKTSKPKKKRATVPQNDEAKQESDLVSYAIDNIPSFRAITPDMSQSQIEDIQRRQAVDFATLRSEVKQQRLEDIDALQGQRAGDITRFSTEMNRIFSRLPDKPYDPLKNLNPQNIETGTDINENTFEGGINEGAPDIKTKLPTEVFPEEEQLPLPRLQPREPIGGRTSSSKRARNAYDLGLEPPLPKGSPRADVLEYYKLLRVAKNEPINPNLNINSKDALFKEINRILDKN